MAESSIWLIILDLNSKKRELNYTSSRFYL